MTLLKELREYALNVMPGHPNDVCSRAADEIERLREALYEVTTNGRWTEGEQRGEWAISNAVYETARDAVASEQITPEPTK